MTSAHLDFSLWVRRFTMLLSLLLAVACGGSNDAHVTPLPNASGSDLPKPVAGASKFGRLFSVASESATSSKANTPTDATPASGKSAQLYSVHTHPSALARIQVGDSFELTMPGMTTLTVRVTFKEVQLGSIFSVGGVVLGEPNSRVQLSASSSAMSGSVMLNGSLWQLRTTAQGTTLQNETANGVIQLPSHTPEAYEKARKAQGLSHDVVQPDTSPTAQKTSGGATSLPSKWVEPITGSVSPRKTAVAQAISAAQPAVIDLLVLSDLSFQNAMGSEANQLAQLASVIAVANQAMADSGAFAQYRLTDYRRLGSDLASDSQESIFINFRALTGVFSGLWPTLVSAGADVAVLVSQYNAAKQGICGAGDLGQFQGSNSQYSNGLPFASRVTFSVGNNESNNSRCSDNTLAHELGHVLGSAHDRANARISGAFSYSHGWGIEGVFGDIMSYLNPQLPFFSNPQLFKCAGRACGTTTDDAVRTFNNTAPLVAAASSPDTRLSGWYYDPQQIGTGWAIEVANGRSFMGGFIYRDDGQPTWVVGSGAPCSAQSSTWCAGLDEYEGGQTLTGPYKPARFKQRVANAEFTFGPGYPAALNLTINGVVRNLRRFEFVTNGLATKPTSPGPVIGGWFHNPVANGTGIFLERQGDQIFAAHLYYRDDGSAAWSIANGINWRLSNPQNPNAGYTSNLLPFVGYANGQTLLGSYKPPLVANPNEANTHIAFGNTASFTSFNSKGTRNNEVWSRFSF